MLTDKVRRPLMLAVLVVAVFGVTPLLNPACRAPEVVDQETGELRPMTPDETEAAAETIGKAAETIVVAAGYPEWLPLVDLVVRVGALVLAWTVRPKAGATSAPPATGTTIPPPV